MYSVEKVVRGIYLKNLTYWGHDKMAVILQTTFFQMQFCIWIGFVGYADRISARVQVMAWRLTGNKPLSEPMLIKMPVALWRD